MNKKKKKEKKEKSTTEVLLVIFILTIDAKNRTEKRDKHMGEVPWNS